jgi:phage replication-related protein YjqB (UPF0714/DUF867 family)
VIQKFSIARGPMPAVSVALLALLGLCLPAAAGAVDTFDCYQDCTGSLLNEPACIESPDPMVGDWHTSCTGLAACPDAGSDVTVLSIHGGKIESKTTEISDALAALYGWNRYDFNAHLLAGGTCRDLEQDGNPNNDNSEVLHITAADFNHAGALALVGAHPDAVAIHGCGGSCDDATICVGGRNTQQVNVFNAYFSQYGGLVPSTVEAVTAPSATPFCGSNIAGTGTQNIVNLTSTGQGLQLEISLDVRKDLASSDLDDELLRGVFYGAVAVAMGELPPPLVTLEAVQTYSSGGTTYERFLLDVENASEYPQELFDPAPSLPPCGINTSAPRTWVYIRDASDDSYVYGFCSLGTPANLNDIWFARPQGTAPATVYVELVDRETGRVYRSNRISTTPTP